MELEVDTVGAMEVEVDTAVGDMEVADTAASTWGGPEVVGTVAATEGAVVPTEGVAATWEETFSNGPKSRCILLKSSHSFEHRPPKCSLDCL